MLTNNEIMEWLLKNTVDDEGNLVLSDLDFSGFKGDIIINNITIDSDLLISNINIKKDLFLNNIINVGGGSYSYMCSQIINDIYPCILNNPNTLTNSLSSIDDYDEEEEGLPFDDELSEDNYSEVY